MPEDIRLALVERGRMDAYLARPEYQQNGYIIFDLHHDLTKRTLYQDAIITSNSV